MKRKELKEYVDLFYRPSRLVLAGAGGVNHQELVDLAKTLFKNPTNLNMDADVPHYSKCRFTGTNTLNFSYLKYINIFYMINLVLKLF